MEYNNFAYARKHILFPDERHSMQHECIKFCCSEKLFSKQSNWGDEDGQEEKTG